MLVLATTNEILNIFRNPTFENIQGLTNDVQSFAVFLAPMLIMVSLAWNFFNNWVEGYPNKTFFDYKTFRHNLIRIILIFLFPLILKGIQGMFQTLRPEGSDVTTTPFLGISTNQKNDQLGYFTRYTGPLDRAILSYMQEHWLRDSGSVKGTGNSTSRMLHKVFTFLHYMNYYLPTFMKMTMALMIVVSPLCAAFSILPIFSHNVEKLLGTFLGLVMTFLTINIVDSLIYGDVFTSGGSLFETMISMLEVSDTINISNTLGLQAPSTVPAPLNRHILYLIFWLSCLGSYYLVFWFTSLLVKSLEVGIMMTIVSIMSNFHEV